MAATTRAQAGPGRAGAGDTGGAVHASTEDRACGRGRRAAAPSSP